MFINTTSEKGQAIVLVALAIVGLIAIVGLMVDVGTVFIDSSRLKRAVDAAAVSAALQYREGYTDTELNEAAEEFITLNTDNPVDDVIIEVCDPGSIHHNGDLCTNPRRKLARVTATVTVNFNFLPIIGINSTTLTTDSISEAASVDVVLVIDSSASMAYEGEGNPNRGDGHADDPSNCNEKQLPNGDPNPDHPCQPFGQIQAAAKSFINNLYFPYDRVALVTFDSGTNYSPAAPWIQDLNSDGVARDEALTAVDNLKVFQPDPCDTAAGSCLNYDGSGNYIGLECPLFRSTGDPTSCGSSNIGGGLRVAGNTFAQTPVREESLWVVILLAGGPANRTTSPDPSRPYGFCPPEDTGGWAVPFCRDASADTRHCANADTRTQCEAAGGIWDPDHYDADDYARDMADFVTSPEHGQNAVIFSIGLGNLMTNAPYGDPDAGEKLLTYSAEQSGGDLANRGIYYEAPTTAELNEIFRKIAENIATRLTH